KKRKQQSKTTMGTATATLSMCQWLSSSSSSSSSLRMHVRFSCRARNLSASAVDKTLCQIKNSGVIACLRANSAEVAMEAANAAIAGGVSVLEIVMSTPGVFEVLEQLVKEHPTMALGVCSHPLSFYLVGTVLRIEDAKTAINAGAKFLMSPAIVKDILVMDYIQSGEILYIPGTMTPTEILSASDAGAKIVKIYPVSALGGFQYISALKKAFPHVSMVASQGITIDAIGEYIFRGASSVVLSDAIFDREAIAQHDFNKIYKLAHSASLLGNKAVS
ncbi:kdgA, partial [Mucuna pruriens]